MHDLVAIIVAISIVIKTISDVNEARKQAAKRREAAAARPRPGQTQPQSSANPLGNPYQSQPTTLSASPAPPARGYPAVAPTPLAGAPQQPPAVRYTAAAPADKRGADSAPQGSSSQSLANERIKAERAAAKNIVNQNTIISNRQAYMAGKKSGKQESMEDGGFSRKGLVQAMVLSQLLSTPRCKSPHRLRSGSSNIT